MNAQRQFNIVGNNKKKSTEKLSSGFKINRAADDAAGLTISEKMRSQIRGLSQGIDNTQDGVSLCQVADGALEEVSDMLHRITELSVKSANGTNTIADRQAIQSEISSLIAEIDRITESTQFNETDIFKPTIIKTGNIMSREEAMAELSTGVVRSVDSDIKDKTGNTIISKDAANSLFANMRLYYAFKDLHDGFERNMDETALYDGANGSQTQKSYQLLKLNITALFSNYNDIYANTGNGWLKPEDNLELYNNALEKAATYCNVNDPQEAANAAEETRRGIGGIESPYYEIAGAISYAAKCAFYKTDPLRYSWTYQNHIDGIRKNMYSADKTLLEKIRDIPSIGNDGYYQDGGLNYYTNAVSNKETIADLYSYLLSDGEISIENKKDIWIQSGAKAGDGMYLTIDAMNTNILGIDDLNASTVNGALKCIDKVKNALNKVNANRSSIGAQQNRLEHTIANESNIVENTTAAESRIRDIDMAKETANLAVQNILTQAGVAIMSQANQSAQGVLQLLQ